MRLCLIPLKLDIQKRVNREVVAVLHLCNSRWTWQKAFTVTVEMTWVTIAQIFLERTTKTATFVLSLLNRMIILLNALHNYNGVG